MNDEVLSDLMSNTVRKAKNKSKGEKLYELINRIDRETDDFISLNEIE